MKYSRSIQTMRMPDNLRLIHLNNFTDAAECSEQSIDDSIPKEKFEPENSKVLEKENSPIKDNNFKGIEKSEEKENTLKNEDIDTPVDKEQNNQNQQLSNSNEERSTSSTPSSK